MLRSAGSEELLVQPTYHVRPVRLLHDEGHIDRRGSLGDDLDTGTLHRAEDPGRKPGRGFEPDTDDRDDCPALVDPDLAQVFQLASDEVEMARIFDGER